MKPQQSNGDQGWSMRQSAGLALNLCFALCWPTSLIFTPEGKRGSRAICGLPGLWALLLLVIWGAMSNSEAMLVILLPLTLLAMLVHYRRSPRDGSVHSYTIGPSAFARLTGDRFFHGRYLEALVTILVGVLLRDEDRGFGNYLIASGVGLMVCVSFLRAKERATDQDLMDARIEQFVRGERLQRPNGR